MGAKGLGHRRTSSSSARSIESLLLGRARDVAPRLLGMTLRCGSREGMIVEVEAYEGENDPASHAFRGPTPRNAIMFGPPGRLYVYRSYGVHWCANVVCSRDGQAAAVLIRAIEPRSGIRAMWADRPKAKTVTDLGSGPGKLCAALAIDGSHTGADMFASESRVRLLERTQLRSELTSGTRVGISVATDRRWRFAIRDNPHVSRPRL